MAENFTEQADALLKSDLSDAHLDVQSLAATYRARRDGKDLRAAVYARALVKRARTEGITAGGLQQLTVKELKAEIDRRNEGRDDDAKLSKSGGKDDLVAVLEADDAKA